MLGSDSFHVCQKELTQPRLKAKTLYIHTAKVKAPPPHQPGYFPLISWSGNKVIRKSTQRGTQIPVLTQCTDQSFYAVPFQINPPPTPLAQQAQGRKFGTISTSRSQKDLTINASL